MQRENPFYSNHELEVISKYASERLEVYRKQIEVEDSNLVFGKRMLVSETFSLLELMKDKGLNESKYILARDILFKFDNSSDVYFKLDSNINPDPQANEGAIITFKTEIADHIKSIEQGHNINDVFSDFQSLILVVLNIPKKSESLIEQIQPKISLLNYDDLIALRNALNHSIDQELNSTNTISVEDKEISKKQTLQTLLKMFDGNKPGLRSWLATSNNQLDNKLPVDLLNDPSKRLEVINSLGRQQYNIPF